MECCESMPSNGKSPTTLGILVGTLRSIFAPHDMTEGLLITISPFEKMTMSINFLIIGQTLRKNVICDQKDPLLRSFPFHQWYETHFTTEGQYCMVSTIL